MYHAITLDSGKFAMPTTHAIVGTSIETTLLQGSTWMETALASVSSELAMLTVHAIAGTSTKTELDFGKDCIDLYRDYPRSMHIRLSMWQSFVISRQLLYGVSLQCEGKTRLIHMNSFMILKLTH